MTLRRYHIAAFILCASLLSCSEATEKSVEDSADQLERQLELHHHKALLSRMAVSGSEPAAFTTDGCSGGLSNGWQHLATQVETVRVTHGELPPWEACCIEHDRLYHAAVPVESSPEDSFVARKQADEELRSCVIDTGFDRATSLSNEYDVSIETVEGLYTTIADLMYRAVRLGGMPCSGLPWRWGYGWPACN
jgi:hypothetical protein